MIRPILTALLGQWSCDPSFEKIGEPLDEKPDMEKAEDISRFADTGIEHPDVNAPDLPGEETPKNHPPQIVTPASLSPHDRQVGVKPRSDGRYLFSFECEDADGDRVRGSARILKDGLSINGSSDYQSPFDTGVRKYVAVNEDEVPSFSHLCWEPTACEDSFGNMTPVNGHQACFDTTDSGVVHYWSFDAITSGPRGFSVADLSGGRKEGILVGNIDGETPGVGGYAVLCDGVNDYIQTPNPGNLGIANTWTVSFWVFVKELKAQGQILASLGKKEPNPTRNSKNYFQIVLQGDNKVNLQYLGDDRTYASFTTANSDLIRLGIWYHFAVAKEVANNLTSMVLYINGVSQTLIGPSNYSPQKDDGDRFITLCKEAGTNAGFFLGAIDEFTLWNVALGPEKIIAECRRNEPIAGRTCGF